MNAQDIRAAALEEAAKIAESWNLPEQVAIAHGYVHGGRPWIPPEVNNGITHATVGIAEAIRALIAAGVPRRAGDYREKAVAVTSQLKAEAVAGPGVEPGM